MASWEPTAGKVSVMMLSKHVCASSRTREVKEFWRAGGQRMSSWEPTAGKASVMLNAHYRTCNLTPKHACAISYSHFRTCTLPRKHYMVKCEWLCVLKSDVGSDINKTKRSKDHKRVRLKRWKSGVGLEIYKTKGGIYASVVRLKRRKHGGEARYIK